MNKLLNEYNTVKNNIKNVLKSKGPLHKETFYISLFYRDMFNRIFNKLENHDDIIELMKPPCNGNDKVISHIFRMVYISFSWVLITEDLLMCISSIIGTNNVLSVCSGKGILENLLNLKYKCNIIKTDLLGYKNVEEIDAIEAIIKYQPKILFVSWLPYDNQIGLKIVETFKGDTIVMIGEINGYNGTKEMFKYLNINFTSCEYDVVERWHDISDTLIVYKRK